MRSSSLILGLCLGCAGLPLPVERQRECPGAIEAVASEPVQLRRRAQYERQVGESKVSFELIIEKKGEHLVVLGLSPFGAKAFAISQRGDELTIERLLGPALAIEPRDVLRDLGHARYLEAERPPARVRIENRRCRAETRLTLVDD